MLTLLVGTANAVEVVDEVLEPTTTDDLIGFGWSICGGVDLDGDGNPEVAVSAVDNTVRVFSMHNAFPSQTDQIEGVGTTGFGGSIACLDDLDGDGFGDLVVGDLLGEAAYIYHGGPDGLSDPTEVTASNGENRDQFGRVVTSLGDVDGDGLSDFGVATDPLNDNPPTVHIFYGHPDGYSDRDHRLDASKTDSSYFAEHLAGVGDVNGDGFDDLLVSDVINQTARIYHGSAEGLDALAPTTDLLDATGERSDYFADSISGAGDVDADGYADVIVGAYADDLVANGDGSALVFYGGPDGAGTRVQRLTPSDADDDFAFGDSVSAAGDLDGDGYDDVAINASEASGWRDAALYLYFGGPEGLRLDSEIKIDPLVTQVYVANRPLAAVGDPDRDGLPEIAVTSGLDEVVVYGLVCHDVDGDNVCDVADCDPGDAGVGGPGLWYIDSDGDGQGSQDSRPGCTAPKGTVANTDDCDDGNADVFTGAHDIPDDGIDQDCSGADAVTPDGGAPGTGEPDTTEGETSTDTTPSGNSETEPGGGKGCSHAPSQLPGGLAVSMLVACAVRRPRSERSAT